MLRVMHGRYGDGLASGIRSKLTLTTKGSKADKRPFAIDLQMNKFMNGR